MPQKICPETGVEGFHAYTRYGCRFAACVEAWERDKEPEQPEGTAPDLGVYVDGGSTSSTAQRYDQSGEGVGRKVYQDTD